MPDFVAINIDGLEDVQRKLKALPEAVREPVVIAVADYMIEDHLKRQPRYKHVTRARAYGDMGYGPGFFSDRQRRWFFAALRSGKLKIPYRRTQALRKGWKRATYSDGALDIFNEVKYAPFVVGDTRQSRHEGLAGWFKLSERIQVGLRKVNDVMNKAANKAIKKLGL